MSYNKELRTLLHKRRPDKIEEVEQDIHIEPSEKADIPTDEGEDDVGNDIDLA